MTETVRDIGAAAVLILSLVNTPSKRSNMRFCAMSKEVVQNDTNLKTRLGVTTRTVVPAFARIDRHVYVMTQQFSSWGSRDDRFSRIRGPLKLTGSCFRVITWRVLLVVTVCDLRRVPRVQAIRTRLRWFAGLRNPYARRASSLASRFRLSEVAFERTVEYA